MTADQERFSKPKSYLGVMVSSTFSDIHEHRAEAIRLIEERQMLPRVMEWDSAKPEDVIESSLQMVRESAAYIGVITHKYGQTPFCPDRNPDSLSLTELEFNEAQFLGRPTLLFIMGEHHKGERSDFEQDPQKLVKLAAFRERAKKSPPHGEVDRVYSVFESLDEFKDTAANAIANLAAFLATPPAHFSSIAPVTTLRSIDQHEPCPEIFGRDDELNLIVESLDSGGHAIIAGGPGFGKTALAVAALYSSKASSKFDTRRVFVSLESEIEPRAILARLADSFGLPSSGEEASLIRQIQIFVSQASTAAILDNLETVHDADRAKTEQVVRLIGQLSGLSLILTLRGNAFVLPDAAIIADLSRLDKEASRQAFVASAGPHIDNDPDLSGLLDVLDGHALSVELVAAQARDVPTLAGIKEAWEELRAALLRIPGEEENRLTSVRASLRLSLQSPALQRAPLSKRLLAILSLLPGGLDETTVPKLLGERGAVSRAKAVEAVSVLRALKLVERRLDRRLRMITPLREAALLDLRPLPADREKAIVHFSKIASLGSIRGTREWDDIRVQVESESDNFEAICRLGLAHIPNSPLVLHALLGTADLFELSGRGSAALLEEAGHFYVRKKNVLNAARILTKLAMLLYIRREMGRAIKIARTALGAATAARSKNLQGDCYDILGDVYGYISYNDESIANYRKAYKVYTNLDNMWGKASALSGLAYVNARKPDPALAIKELKEAKKIFESIDGTLGATNVEFKIITTEQVDVDIRLKPVLEAYRLLDIPISESNSNLYTALYLARTRRYKQALIYAREAARIAREIGDVTNEALSMIISELATDQTKLSDTALAALKMGFSLLRSKIDPQDKAAQGWDLLEGYLTLPEGELRENAAIRVREAWEAAGRHDLVRLWLK